MAPVALSDNNTIQPNTKWDINEKTITISEYIYLRIFQLGVKSIFGVPGDFNLNFLENIYKTPLNWIGCCNELNAAYAADAYAKASKKMSVLLTTYGVGELSAINGIAGSYCEFVPVLHLVGTSSLKMKQNKDVLNLHHLLSGKNNWEKSDHYIYEKVAQNFSIDSFSIEDNEINAVKGIDRVIESIWKENRPGYIFLPCDLANMEVNSKWLDNPLNLEYPIGNLSRTDEIVELILQKIYSSKNVTAVIDDFVRKFRVEDVVSNIIEKFDGKVNLTNTTSAQGLIDSNNKRFMGVYCGKQELEVAKIVEDSDFILHIGKFDHEMNNGFFSFALDPKKTAVLHPKYVEINGERIFDVTMMDILPKILERLETTKVNESTKFEKPKLIYEQVESDQSYPLTEVDLIKTLNNCLRPNDILIVETCSFLFGVPDIKFKNGAKVITQSYWASIGYALPATLGASLALRDFNLPGKVITVEGDGSAQMSLQELSSMIRYNIEASLIILNNDGYTIERVIQGPNSSYNDINAQWQWTKLLSAFGDVTNEKTKSCTVNSREEIHKLFESDQFYNESKFQLIELILPKFDVPHKLQQLFVKK